MLPDVCLYQLKKPLIFSSYTSNVAFGVIRTTKYIEAICCNAQNVKRVKIFREKEMNKGEHKCCWFYSKDLC